jgi:hypothetical protein
MRHAQRAIDNALGVLVEAGPAQAPNPHASRATPRLRSRALPALPAKSDQAIAGLCDSRSLDGSY